MAKAAKRTRHRTEVQRSDRHDLYQRAVQCVEAEIDFVDNTYKRLRGHRAISLREDFCGTAGTCCEWVRRRAGNRAVGLDIHGPTLDWGTKHNLSALSAEQRSRVDLRRVSVLDDAPGRVEGGFDAILAMNFSYWCFKDRPTMLTYYRAAMRALAADGIFFLDFYGGPDALREIQEKRRIAAIRARLGGGGGAPGFTYVWDQARYDPITGDILCHIHFRFADGSEMTRAFTYDWRLWTIPELRDILMEAGFARVTVYWEGDDEKGGGNGIFRPRKHGEACPAYIAYLVAEK